jgi:hypothetical protein
MKYLKFLAILGLVGVAILMVSTATFYLNQPFLFGLSIVSGWVWMDWARECGEGWKV